MISAGGDETGMSPVIGVALLFVIVVLLSVTAVVMMTSFTDQLSRPAPMFERGGHVQMALENGTIGNQSLVLVHEGGAKVPVDGLEVTIDTGNGTIQRPVSATGDLRDGSWTAGEKLSIPLNSSEVCTGSDSVDVAVTYSGRGTSYVLGRRTVPVERGGFTIENGSVVPISDYRANATVLGTGFTYGAGGPRIDIRLDVTIGGTAYDPWPGNVNNMGNPRSHTFTNQPAGAPISIAATGDKNGIYISPRTRNSSADNGWVYVLRDGDTPPNIAGFGDQESAASYVKPYLDGDGKISLADNQAIYLFELGNSQSGPAADYQDVVVLVSLRTRETTVGVRHVRTGETALVCPKNG
ncbi:MAG: type IV pilin [Salinigranum sp.]